MNKIYKKLIIGIFIGLLLIYVIKKTDHFILCEYSPIHPQCSMNKQVEEGSKLCTGKNLAYAQCQSPIVRQQFLTGQVVY